MLTALFLIWRLAFHHVGAPLSIDRRSSYRPMVMGVRWLMPAETGTMVMILSLSCREYDDLVAKKRGTYVWYLVQNPNVDEIAVTYKVNNGTFGRPPTPFIRSALSGAAPLCRTVA
ncbi:uncharacterized protein FFB20_12005 [Fusarium fujikuroi]|nr:uncharacterized protein FFE2_01167 [Fusarium fujikuroi]SCN71179.1 uncharacterized protein FFC1_01163 [Fusarium fujikuroi]SCN75044.1 uncharacterized protein FFM5_01122 [Fusarium fujikuroi]SCO03748.1 uncharacterized protein FFB20_12005 [Fusarium fujikuroi]SCO28631.1 uncharacterized protein FFMR_01063 [Fusarium fujikuroi]